MHNDKPQHGAVNKGKQRRWLLKRGSGRHLPPSSQRPRGRVRPFDQLRGRPEADPPSGKTLFAVRRNEVEVSNVFWSRYVTAGDANPVR